MKTVYKRTISYVGIFRWLLIDSTLHFRKTILGVLALTGFALICQIGAIGLIFKYIKALEVESVYEFSNLSINIQDSFGALVSVAMISFLLLVSYAALNVWQQKKLISLRHAYKWHCVERYIAKIKILASSKTVTAKEIASSNELSTLGEREADACAKSLEHALRLVPDFLAILIFSALLFAIDGQLSLILLCLSLMALYPLYLVNIRIAHFGKVANKDRSSIKKMRIETKKKFNEAPSLFHGEALSTYFSFLKLNDKHEYNKLHSKAKSDMVVNILTACIFGFVVVYQGEKFLAGQFPWGQMIVYFTALRFLLMALKGAITKLSKISGDYTLLKAYFLFIRGN